MDHTKVKDLMIPVAAYAGIPADATLGEAQVALDQAREKSDGIHKLRTLLVYDEQSRIIGTVSLLDMLKAMEPKYKNFGNFELLSRFGFSPGFYDYITKDVDILQKPLDDLCEKAARLKVEEFMQPVDPKTHIETEDSLNLAIHKLVFFSRQFLLVTNRDGDIEGMLRLVDVAGEIGERMKACTMA